jgi:hypothetical protein
MQTILLLFYLGCLAALMLWVEAARWVISIIRSAFLDEARLAFEESQFLTSLKQRGLLYRWVLKYGAGRHNG